MALILRETDKSPRVKPLTHLCNDPLHGRVKERVEEYLLVSWTYENFLSFLRGAMKASSNPKVTSDLKALANALVSVEAKKTDPEILKEMIDESARS